MIDPFSKSWVNIGPLLAGVVLFCVFLALGQAALEGIFGKLLKRQVKFIEIVRVFFGVIMLSYLGYLLFMLVSYLWQKLF